MKHKILPFAEPHDWLTKLTDAQQNACLLTSNGDGWETIVAWNPAAIFSCRRDDENGTRNIARFIDDQTDQSCRVIGFVSYDLGYKLHGINQTATDNLGLPDMYFLAFRNYLKITSDASIICYQDADFVREIEQIQSERPQVTQAPFISEAFSDTITENSYKQAYQRVKRYILDGDAYQVNLTHQLNTQTDLPPRQLFAQIAKHGRTNFMAYLEGPDFAIHSASPERFVRVQGRSIETLPIKGTRPRGQDAKQDQALKSELLGSAKDAAELNMITDLLRNDLGRICTAGSVDVLAKRHIMETSTVLHTYSHIRGELLPGIRPIEAVLSMFPGGSITGCPKKRAMEIIDGLEPTTRSVYCGSIISTGPCDQLDSNIAIRTIIQKDRQLYLSVGGGIVQKSDEKAEYQETWDKAQGIIQALGPR